MVMDVIAAATRLEAAGHPVIHMEVGQPAAPAPRTAIEAARRALDGPLRYTEALGIGSLRARIARHYAETYDVDLDPARVIVTTGSSAGFILAFLAMFEPGDRVGIANPGYPPYRHILKALGCEPVLIETSESTRWAVTPEAVLAEHRKQRLAGLLVASPANPTGTMMRPEALAALIGMADEAGIRFISDEIYHGLDYAFPAETALRLSSNALVINSFSKYFCMTGWRIGWMVAPEPLVRAIERLQGNLAISVPTLSQIAAEAAFDGRDEMDAVKHTYEANRRHPYSKGCRRRGSTDFCRWTAPSISMPTCRAFPTTRMISRKRCSNRRMSLRPRESISIRVDGRHYLRFCYAGSQADMSEAVTRIGQWLTRR